MATIPIFLPGKFHGQRSLVATAHGVTKEWNVTKHACTIFAIQHLIVPDIHHGDSVSVYTAKHAPQEV